MRPASRTLIVFTRLPEPGRTKTRLIPALGAEGAAELQRAMSVHTLIRARRAARNLRLTLEVHHAGGEPEAFHDWLGPDLSYRPQAAGDLGQRMAEACSTALADGASSVVVVGTDCPELDEAVLDQAFAELERSDVVLGPARDGGYYLIGLRRAHPELFEGISWGTETVLAETLAAAARMGLEVGRLATLSDVDLPEDLSIWESAGSARAATPVHTSVIIPTLNEAGALAATLAEVVGEPGVEAIVADGGSCDATLGIAEAHGARVVQAGRGRGRQMNAGAAAAAGSILLFLHADTMLPRRFGGMIAEALDAQGVVGGAFRFRLDVRSPGLRLVELGANLRSRWLGLPYGDQALFLRADVFRSLGGYPECPIMEDVVFVRNLRRRGRLRILRQAATTSARRWRQLGAWRTTGLHWAALAAYACGLSPAQIHAWLTRWVYFSPE